jgi:Cys-rich protein (TIGR01571 family)
VSFDQNADKGSGDVEWAKPAARWSIYNVDNNNGKNKNDYNNEYNNQHPNKNPCPTAIFELDQISLSFLVIGLFFSLVYLIQTIFFRYDYSKRVENRGDFLQSCLVHLCCTSCSLAQMGAQINHSVWASSKKINMKII